MGATGVWLRGQVSTCFSGSASYLDNAIAPEHFDEPLYIAPAITLLASRMVPSPLLATAALLPV
ncbi:MAG: hypothetical protein CMJ46_00260 [Planctomyces sp.]|nr:hypothetical protein [Planctomyces sp.]